MNPYLEHPSLWPEMHTYLLVCLARKLNTQVIPKYRAAINQRVYEDTVLVGIPDTTVFQKSTVSQSLNEGLNQATAIASKPERVTVPMLEEVKS